MFNISFASLANTTQDCNFAVAAIVRARKKTKLHEMHMDALGRLEIGELQLKSD